jgi:hypothetical protein
VVQLCRYQQEDKETGEEGQRTREEKTLRELTTTSFKGIMVMAHKAGGNHLDSSGFFTLFHSPGSRDAEIQVMGKKGAAATAAP